MTALRISGGTLVTPFAAIEDAVLLARDGVIAYAGPGSAAPAEPANVEIDATGLLVCPGFIDLQVNGGGGALLTAAPTRETVARMCAAHARYGTTALLPTAVTAPEDNMAQALAAVAQAARDQPGGARVLGSHLEGPFISTVRKGAHDERFILDPDVALFERLYAASGGTLRVITLAPELPGALDLIAAAREKGVVVSIGHTDATEEETLRAIAAGASLGTHLFNGMRPLHHREPGVIGALMRGDAVAGIIPDNVHVAPALLDVAYRVRGPLGLALVTDALVTPDEGIAELQGRAIELRDGAYYLANGTLAGSALTMDRAVRNMRDASAAGLIECVQMATATPAAVLGLEKQIGVLMPGASADVLVCDRDMNVEKVVVAGELVYEAR